jgi:hypothetical protein
MASLVDILTNFSVFGDDLRLYACYDDVCLYMHWGPLISLLSGYLIIKIDLLCMLTHW